MEVHVRASARLHLGIIDPNGALGRKYGSIGVAIGRPHVKVRAEKSKDIVVTCRRGVEVSPAEVRGYASRVLRHFRIKGGAKIKVDRDMPKHVGLGSTTQTALSVAAAITRLYDVRASIRELSSLLGRGKVSGIGTKAFETGGFIVDGGVRRGQGPPPALLRVDFPEDWSFVVVVPSIRRGLKEREEKKVFEKISAPPKYAKEISHALVMKMLPALFERDIERFGDALSAIQVLVGRSFSPYQEGIYHSKTSEDLVKFLLKSGARGCGQSSWGPTVYGLVKGMKKCRRLKNDVEKFMANKGLEGTVYCTAANNRGATIWLR